MMVVFKYWVFYEEEGLQLVYRSLEGRVMIKGVVVVENLYLFICVGFIEVIFIGLIIVIYNMIFGY